MKQRGAGVGVAGGGLSAASATPLLPALIMLCVFAMDKSSPRGQLQAEPASPSSVTELGVVSATPIKYQTRQSREKNTDNSDSETFARDLCVSGGLPPAGLVS